MANIALSVQVSPTSQPNTFFTGHILVMENETFHTRLLKNISCDAPTYHHSVVYMDMNEMQEFIASLEGVNKVVWRELRSVTVTFDNGSERSFDVVTVKILGQNLWRVHTAWQIFAINE